jgi:hypothetical protein
MIDSVCCKCLEGREKGAYDPKITAKQLDRILDISGAPERKRRTFVRQLENGTLEVINLFGVLKIKPTDLPPTLQMFRGVCQGILDASNGPDDDMAMDEDEGDEKDAEQVSDRPML